MLYVEAFVAAGSYDVIIIDSAPTGETLTFLTLPQTVQWWLTKAFPLQRKAILAGGAVVRTMTGIPLDHGYTELEQLFEKLDRVQKLMCTPSICSIRLVVNPERMVIREAKRAYTYLQLYGYGVDAVLINRIWPEAIRGTVFGKYVEAQQAYVEEIEDSFAPVPVLRVPHLGEEVYGPALLAQVGQALYAANDPAAVLYEHATHTLEQDGEAYHFSIHLPLVDPDAFSNRTRSHSPSTSWAITR